jgi:hypothetical protein
VCASLLAGCIQTVESVPMTEHPVVEIEALTLGVYSGNGSLEGHVWQIAPVAFVFQSGSHVIVRGGPLSESMSHGAPGTYALEDGTLELEVLGRVYAGSWTGLALTLDDRVAEYMGDTETIYPELVLD